jgi:nucleotide-binding universal stress UspA family protein
MMKKIIVPVDFSRHSEFALETAAQLAKKNNAEILAVHMLEMTSMVLNASEGEQQAKAVFFLKLAEKRFEDFLDKDYLEGILVTPVVKHFKVFSEISEVGKEHGGDLIVMGSHGTSGMKEVFVGSNAEKVVRNSDIPVLVVKHNPILTEFENVVFASDFSKDSVKSYTKARDLFEGLGAKMHLLHVNLPTQSFRSSVEIEQKVADFLKIADGNLNNMDKVNFVSDYNVESGITNFSNKIGADLIAVTTHGRKGIAHFFEGSISEDIANHSALPVMTFKI